ncbi:MAG: hypothetical protein EA366_09025 [Spirulina sp. DLM2.Bin59]|nr:MAG: hypothetical protein EA366_09025 [Spirulina sp. DLM2.Bin59]
MRLKRWESPRRQGRNHKGKGGSARQRQVKKQHKFWSQRLKQNPIEKEGDRPPSSVGALAQACRRHTNFSPSNLSPIQNLLFKRSRRDSNALLRENHKAPHRVHPHHPLRVNGEKKGWELEGG